MAKAFGERLRGILARSPVLRKIARPFPTGAFVTKPAFFVTNRLFRFHSKAKSFRRDSGDTWRRTSPENHVTKWGSGWLRHRNFGAEAGQWANFRSEGKHFTIDAGLGAMVFVIDFGQGGDTL